MNDINEINPRLINIVENYIFFNNLKNSRSD